MMSGTNPAKITDSRAKGYIRKHGTEAWELDALSPDTISDLIAAEIKKLVQPKPWKVREALKAEGIAALEEVQADL